MKTASTLLLALTIFLLSCGETELLEEENHPPELVLNHFEKLADLSEYIESTLYPEFDYIHQYPIYLILDSGDSTLGYFINPPGNIRSESIPLSSEDKFGLNIYRNDEYIDEAAAHLGELSFFDFYYTIEDTEMFLVKPRDQIGNFYYDFKNIDDNNVALLIAHELFHIYQFEEWQSVPGQTQNISGFPLTLEIIELELLLFDQMSQAFQSQSEAECIKYLKYYLAIMEALVDLDSGPEQLITHMAMAQEWREGTARFIEHFGAKETIYPTINDDPSHGWGNELSTTTSGDQVRIALAFRIWYHTGAAVTYLLQIQGIAVDALFRQGQTPFVIAKATMEAIGESWNNSLTDAKSSVAWESFQAEAQRLIQLIE